MKLNKWTKLAWVAILCSSILTACSSDSQGTANETSTENQSTSDGTAQTTAYADQFDKTQIMSISIDAEEDAWQEMLDNPMDETYISADITINGTTIKNVGIRPKGNSSLSQVAQDDTTDRYSFKIKFDEYVKDQTWEGLDKLVVNNMIQDSSYMKEYLSYDIMSYIGVDAPLFSLQTLALMGTPGDFIWLLKISMAHLKPVPKMMKVKYTSRTMMTMVWGCRQAILQLKEIQLPTEINRLPELRWKAWNLHMALGSRICIGCKVNMVRMVGRREAWVETVALAA